MVNGQRQPYIRNSRHEAKRAARLLSASCGFPVVVAGVVVPVRAADVAVKDAPDVVFVVPRAQVARWLQERPEVLRAEVIEAIFAAARRSTTEVCCSHRTVTQEGRISPEEEGSLCRSTVSSLRSTATKRC